MTKSLNSPPPPERVCRNHNGGGYKRNRDGPLLKTTQFLRGRGAKGGNRLPPPEIVKDVKVKESLRNETEKFLGILDHQVSPRFS
jgi:hypothetical protein